MLDTMRIGVKRYTPEGKPVYALMPTVEIKHALGVGATGHGKTEFQKLIASECVRLGYGLLAIDPHGGLAQYLAALLAAKGLDFVYIAPRLTMQLGKTVKLNPLDIDRERVNTVITQIKNLSTHWGQRLEAVLRNALLLVLSLPREFRNINVVRRVVIDQEFLATLLNRLADKELHLFWEQTFPSYGPEAGASAYNKIDSLLTNPMVRAVVDTSLDVSEDNPPIDFGDIVRNKQRVILDLSEIDYESASFIGSIAIMMLYSKVQRMAERRERKENPFFLIVDEAQQFAPDLREPLNMFRKFNIKMVLGTQSLSDKRIPFADEIIELTNLVCAFKIGADTAKLLRPVLHASVRDNMANMPKFQFSAYAGPEYNGVLTTKRMTLPPEYDPDTEQGKANIMKAISDSIDRHGVTLSMEKYLPRQREVQTKLTVLQHGILCYLWNNGFASERQELYDRLAHELELESKDVQYALREIERMGVMYLENSGDTVALLNTAKSEYFLDVPRGQRGGGDKHSEVIGQIANYFRQKYNYVIVDTGGTNQSKADVLVIPHRMNPETKVLEWDYDNIRVFEVETDPVGHKEQVFKNWSKNYGIGYQVNFVVFNERDRGHVMNILTEKGIQSEQYRVWLVSELPQPAKYAGLDKELVVEQTKGFISENKQVFEALEKPVVSDDYDSLKAQLRANPNDETIVNKLISMGFDVRKIEDGAKWRIRKKDHFGKNIDNEVVITRKKRNESI